MTDIKNIGVEKGKVLIIDFQTDWNDMFKSEQKYLSNILQIEQEKIFHIGSTAIPDCKAKPIIDIAIPYESLYDSNPHQRILMTTEYAINNIYYLTDRVCFTKGTPQRYHLYLVDKDSPTFTNWMLFKEALTENINLRQNYCDLKVELSKLYPDDRIKYTEEKTKFIFSILNNNSLWQAKVLSMKT